MNKQELIEKIKKMDSYMFNFRPHINETQVLNYIRQLDEPQKPVVPQFVADWIEVCKEHLTSSLYLAMTPSFLKANNQGIELTIWIKKNEETFARAWLDGYEVEQEKRYLVKMKGMVEDFTVLKLDKIRDGWYLGNDTEYSYTKVKHTRKELEEAGFGWVFDCKGIEVKEVKE
jgi:hypothetical protein|nr:MAG TPA: Protein of unknown function (DUF1642) [Caudoviricetes sp.]